MKSYTKCMVSQQFENTNFMREREENCFYIREALGKLVECKSVCVCVHADVCVHMWVPLCVCVCMHVYVCVCNAEWWLGRVYVLADFVALFFSFSFSFVLLLLHFFFFLRAKAYLKGKKKITSCAFE